MQKQIIYAINNLIIQTSFQTMQQKNTTTSKETNK